MPLKKDPEGGGLNADGTRNHMYCSYCYEKGSFKQADWTVEQMRQFVIGKLVEMKFPRFLARLFSKNIYKLERWA